MKKERRQNYHLTFIKVSGGIQASNSFLLINVPLNNAFPHPFPLLAVSGTDRQRNVLSLCEQGHFGPHLPRSAEPQVRHREQGEQGTTAAPWPLAPAPQGCCSPDQEDRVCLVWQGKPLPFRCLLTHESELAPAAGARHLCTSTRARVRQ